MRYGLALMIVCVSTSLSTAIEKQEAIGKLQVQPESMRLVHRRHPHSILVTALNRFGQSLDMSSQATYLSKNPKIAKATALGWIVPVGNGQTEIEISVGGQKRTVKVDVKIPKKTRQHSFRHDIMPVLSKGGCNSGACHGYSLGKNGFKLSLRGSDAGPDHAAITDEFLERRINRHQVGSSLMVTKPLGDVPHKGGVRFERGGLLHQYLSEWIAEGANSDVEKPLRLVSTEVFPKKAILQPGTKHQIQLLANYSDGSVRDVTRLGIFTANTGTVASVDDSGLVTAGDLGETAIVARFERVFATSNIIVLKPRPGFKPTPLPKGNVVDTFVVKKLNYLKVKASALVGDERYLRRVYLDLIGIQPTPTEVRAFLANRSANKRAEVVEGLFRRSEFVDRWSLKWGDLLQNSRQRLSSPAVYSFRQWIRASVASNMPLDRFVREILTSRGGFSDQPASAYYVVSKDVDDTLQRATQVFCGIRMLCAKCHPHPFENWTQADYYGLHSFFNQVTTKNDPRLPGNKKARSVVLNLPAGYSLNPRSQKLQPPRFLGGGEPKIAAGKDRRVVYAKWLTSAENPFFARSMTNRIWSYFFHRGIIDPVDDLRTTNPPINPELLDELTKEFVAHKFDVRQLMRTIVNSQTYQRSSVSNATNGHDNLNFSRFIPRRISAETLLDCIVQSTGVAENFPGAPGGFTAKQLPDANVNSEFLNLFGKPKRMEACECERDDGANMLQALHFINGKSILSRVANANGRVAKLLKQKLSDPQLVVEMYLWTVARRPSAAERKIGSQFLQSYGAKKRSEAAQDLMWALLNSRDYMLVH